MDLDPTTRGIIETWIEFQLEDSSLEGLYKTAKYYFKIGAIDSIKSCMFGLLSAGTEGVFYTWIRKFKREPSEDELMEFMRIFEERVPKIKSRILEITSK